jgi:hypothetical protein
MTDIRFIEKHGQSVGLATMRKRFFESAADAEVDPKRASFLWDAAMFGNTHARKLIEDLCEIQLVRSDAGFGFLQ